MATTPSVTSVSPVFSFESNQLSVSIDEHGDPWFIASEVCAILGIRNPRDAMSRLDDDEKGVGKTDTLGGAQEVTTISEPGLYRLIGRSNKPTAKRFNRWMCHEVLPTIRKTGRYQMPNSPTSSPAIAITAQNGRYLVEVDAEQRCKVISRIADDSVIISRATAKTVMEVISMASSMLTSANSELHQQLDSQLHIRA